MNENNVTGKNKMVCATENFWNAYFKNLTSDFKYLSKFLTACSRVIRFFSQNKTIFYLENEICQA